MELTRISYKKGALIVVEGKGEDDRFFVILQGQVHISRMEVVVAESWREVLGPGDFFAVVSVMADRPQIESVRAITDVVLMAVHRDQFENLVHEYSTIAIKIIRDFSRRLKHLDGSLGKILLDGTAEESPEHLYQVGIYYQSQNKLSHAAYCYERYLHWCPDGEFVEDVKRRMGGIKSNYIDLDRARVPRLYPAGSVIFAEGEPGDELYSIERGIIKLSKIVDNKEVVVAMLKEGDIFGEMEILEKHPRSLTAVVEEECEVRVVKRENLEKTIKEKPGLIAHLITLQAERLWFIYMQLENALVKEPLARMFDMLRIMLDKNRVDHRSEASHLFDFGPAELTGMVGIPNEEAEPFINKLMEYKCISLVQGQICTTNVSELDRLANYFKTKQKLDEARESTKKTQRKPTASAVARATAAAEEKAAAEADDEEAAAIVAADRAV